MSPNKYQVHLRHLLIIRLRVIKSEAIGVDHQKPCKKNVETPATLHNLCPYRLAVRILDFHSNNMSSNLIRDAKLEDCRVRNLQSEASIGSVGRPDYNTLWGKSPQIRPYFRLSCRSIALV